MIIGTYQEDGRDSFVTSTVAVALITAGSTLMGGALSAVTALLIGRLNNSHQLALAVAERSEHAKSGQRQILRDAYVQLLNQLSATNRSFNVAWRAIPPSEFDAGLFVAPVVAELESLQQTANLVFLEGPAPVSRIAAELIGALTLQSLDLAKAASESRGHAPCLLDEQLYTQTKMRAASIHGRLIAAMQAALSDHDTDEGSRPAESVLLSYDLRDSTNNNKSEAAGKSLS